ncbi:hypothetical protein AAY55_07995 [Vibrio metoecus]|uniref:Uncharacterized protein n=1 Tax=Vibrio metoecus TaxID=1481663 RepID=A0A0Q0MUD8_VIBMT|nr:hypothetical protein AAY55_07995 [Vibrio metoecus]
MGDTQAVNAYSNCAPTSKKYPPLCEFWLSFVHLSRYIDMKSKICRIFLLSKLRFYGFHERG